MEKITYPSFPKENDFRVTKWFMRGNRSIYRSNPTNK